MKEEWNAKIKLCCTASNYNFNERSNINSMQATQKKYKRNNSGQLLKLWKKSYKVIIIWENSSNFPSFNIFFCTRNTASYRLYTEGPVNLSSPSQLSEPHIILNNTCYILQVPSTECWSYKGDVVEPRASIYWELLLHVHNFVLILHYHNYHAQICCHLISCIINQFSIPSPQN